MVQSKHGQDVIRFKGDIRHAASQQKYMWNRGNSVDYSDPSGYSTVVNFDSTAQTLRIIGVSGTSDAGIDVTFKAANNVVNPKGDPMQVGSKGPMPDGVWNLGPMQVNSATEKAAYGNVDFFPLTDKVVGNGEGSRGLGIHSGRHDPNSVTEGCIRTTDAAMKFLKAHPPVLLEVNWPGSSGGGHHVPW